MELSAYSTRKDLTTFIGLMLYIHKLLILNTSWWNRHISANDDFLTLFYIFSSTRHSIFVVSATSVLLRCRIIRYFIITFNHIRFLNVSYTPYLDFPPWIFHVRLLWPTASGITEIQAREICQEPILEAAAVFELCSNYTKQSFEIITASCMLDLQVRNSSSLLLKTELCVVSVVSLSQCRGVHGNGEDWDPMGPMGFPWEWE